MKKSDCYYGIYPLRFVYHGEWADPEIVYKGHAFNYFELDALFFEFFKEDTENLAPDLTFEEWIHKNHARIKEHLNFRIELAKFDR